MLAGAARLLPVSAGDSGASPCRKSWGVRPCRWLGDALLPHVAFADLNRTASASPDTNISALGAGNKFLKKNKLWKKKAGRSCVRERKITKK